MRYKCKICGRDKFQNPSPHWCGSVYLKHYGRKKYKQKYNGTIWVKLEERDDE